MTQINPTLIERAQRKMMVTLKSRGYDLYPIISHLAHDALTAAIGEPVVEMYIMNRALERPGYSQADILAMAKAYRALFADGADQSPGGEK